MRLLFHKILVPQLLAVKIAASPAQIVALVGVIFGFNLLPTVITTEA